MNAGPLVASDDSTLKLWNVASGQELLTIRHLGGALSGLIFSPDGTLLATARNYISVWRGSLLKSPPSTA